MLIDSASAHHFIQHYQELLTEIGIQTGLVQAPEGWDSVVHFLTAVRNRLAQQPELLEPALAALQERNEPVADDVLAAIHSMRTERWIYLRDTTGYSVLLDSQNEEAGYAVKGLTTTLKDMLGDSGAIIQCGLLLYRGQVITDGLVGFAAWIGPNYRRSFNERLRQLRANGQLYGDRVLPPQAPRPDGQAPAASKPRAKKTATTTKQR